MLMHKSIANNLVRKRFTIEKKASTHIQAQGVDAINFCSNDYLNLSQHPKIIASVIRGMEEFGLGSGASSLVAGFYQPQKILEEKFSEILNRERSLFFNSGYHANLGLITALANKNTTIIADKLCHASIIDGIRLSGAKHFRYPHGNLAHAENLLLKYPQSLLITENVFSMEGTIADIKTLAKLAKNSASLFIVDDAHGFGVLDRKISQEDVPCLVIPLGKACGGTGAIVSGKADLIEIILQKARTYCYTTALPPAICYGILEALNLIREETWRREKLNALIQYFIQGAKARELPLVSSDTTPIKSILIGDNQKVISIQKTLLEKGFFVSCIRPPTVPKNTARIRISLNCLHEENEIEKLLDELYECYKKFI